jgi:hypothetical protein
MQIKAGYLLWLPVALLLVVFLLAGCGADYAVAPFGMTPTAVHIQRTGYYWNSVDGTTQAQPAIDVSSTNSARVAEFFDHVRSLPVYSPATPVICSNGGGENEVTTLISFLAGSTVLLQVKMIAAGCVFTSIVGEPNTLLQTDDLYFAELDFLIAYPT